MKLFTTLLFGFALMSAVFLPAVEQKNPCTCKDCKCTQESNCGCMTESGCSKCDAKNCENKNSEASSKTAHKS